jgi:CheY-like chemotaxis protein
MAPDRPTKLPERTSSDVEEHVILPGAPHVLIVDDNQANRVVVAAFCELFSCTYESARGGREAVEAMRDRRFDLVLMDIQMPDMDGMEATRLIRALPGPGADTPVVAVTASYEPSDVRAYRAAGMCDVVEKPIEPAQLLRAMSKALNATNADLSGWRPAAA